MLTYRILRGTIKSAAYQSKASKLTKLTTSTNLTTKDIIKDLSRHPRSNTESKAIKILEEIMTSVEHRVVKFPSVYPSWLIWKNKRLELDGYNKDLRLAIEVDGHFHHKWFHKEETYQKYFNRLVKDIVKNKLCEKNHVNLIRLDSLLPREHWRDYLLSRLYDYKYIKDEPTKYIIKQEYESFRNNQLEKELGLSLDNI
jgi:hypothetical protein